MAGRKLCYRSLRERAEAIRWSMWHRAQRLCEAAGLDCAGTIHNARIDRDRGRPWRGVDYAKADAAHDLFGRQFIATRWLSRLVEARGQSAFIWD
ncbi:MAG: hypothetical protein EPN91_12040 [Salinibacterium sp.]|nr:MAG: hypothetical protein EPN91_12040 [Salinibacterium sp.]